MKVKEGDFIELEYTGIIIDSGMVFDTTDKELGATSGLDPEMIYGPAVICMGQGQLLPGLEKMLVGKEMGEYEFDLAPHEAFGKKDPKKIRLMNINAFKKENIHPSPGMQVTVDNDMGTVKTVTGGRVIVDFNSPLSGKDLKYKIKLLRKVDDDVEKLKGYMKLSFGVDTDPKITEGKAVIDMKKEMNPQIKTMIADKVKEVIPTIKELDIKP